MDKFTKIVATIGPASDSIETIEKLYKAGMNVARLNFSHGSYEYFTDLIKKIRNVSEDIGILLDTKGPEIRTGEIKDGKVILIDNQELIITNKEIIGDNNKITLFYDDLMQLDIGNRILIDDGLIETEVIRKEKNEIVVEVLNGGELGSKKTVSIQGHSVNIPFLSEKDKKDIDFGIENNFDFIAASFVRNAQEVLELREYLQKKKSKIRVISKIEHGDAIKNINEIIDASQGIMVARGDLGVEIPLEKVPMIQREIIHRCNELGRPVIVATQMLESMKDNPRPTRAEVADVAVAILQGADAIMLSGETASGKYPVKAVKTMAKIAKEYDKVVKTKILDNLHSENVMKNHSVSLFMTKSAYQASEDLKTTAILTPTESGFTARKVSRFKPRCPIYAITHDKTVVRQLQLSWGVHPMLEGEDSVYKDHDGMVNSLVKYIYEKGYVVEENKVVVTSGHTLMQAGHTNMIEVYGVKHILDRIKNSI